MTSGGPHISIAAETLFSIGSLEVSNSILTSVLVSIILIGFAIVVRLNLKQTDKPKGIQNFAEWVVESLYNFINSITGDAQKTRLFLPLVSTFFLFIILNNWLGLLPGVGTVTYNPTHEENQVGLEHIADQAHSPESIELVIDDHTQTALANDAATTEELENAQDQLEQVENELLKVEEELENQETSAQHHAPIPILRPGTADLNTTLALALVSVVATQIFGIGLQRLSYLKKFINFSSPIMFFVGVLELVSEIAKVISFAFRLFGNIFAGEVLLVVIAFLLPIIAPMPFYGLELFVGFIQALVFSMLSLVFFNMATQGHDH